MDPSLLMIFFLLCCTSCFAHICLLLRCTCTAHQVSDLDGTMVGEGEEADAATAEFGAYWEDNAALAGGVLVYNTGR